MTRNAIATMRRGERIREPDAENRRIAPLACMNEWGHVTMHEALTTAIADSRPHHLLPLQVTGETSCAKAVGLAP